MTTEDLILGHFDGTLTPEEESRLQAEMNASPAARALYEQHKSLHMMLNADAASLVPSSRLDKAVVTAALSAVPETIGGGALSWLTTKVAVGISAVVVGGLSIVMLSNSGSDEPPVPAATPVPSVSNAPAVPQTSAPVTLEAPKGDEVRVQPPAAPRAEAPARGDAPRSRNGARDTERVSASSGASASGTKKRSLRLDSVDQTTIDGGTKIVPQDSVNK